MRHAALVHLHDTREHLGDEMLSLALSEAAMLCTRDDLIDAAAGGCFHDKYLRLCHPAVPETDHVLRSGHDAESSHLRL